MAEEPGCSIKKSGKKGEHSKVEAVAFWKWRDKRLIDEAVGEIKKADPEAIVWAEQEARLLRAKTEKLETENARTRREPVEVSDAQDMMSYICSVFAQSVEILM